MSFENQVRFDWCIHLSCNYRCRYCFFDGEWIELANRNVYKSVDEWMEVWRRLHKQYGRIYLVINGGEPFIYPNFVELIYQVQQLHGPINICTNVSQMESIKTLMARMKENWINHLSITLSFHPQFENIDNFLKKTKELRSIGVDIGALNFVVWPPFLKDLKMYMEKFREARESIRIHPFIGNHEGVNYPDAYTTEEREIMKLPTNWEESKRPKGRLCYAGNKSGLIHPDGAVTRCGQGEWGNDPFGNVFDPNFTLQKSPQPCHAESCPCDKWKVFPEKEERPKEAEVWHM